MFGWRNHGGVDPDSQRVWWHSETGELSPTHTLALNFGGIDDPDIDEQLDDHPEHGRRRPSSQAAAEEINRIFGEQVYNIWNTWTVWGLAYQPTVHGINDVHLPGRGAHDPGRRHRRHPPDRADVGRAVADPRYPRSLRLKVIATQARPARRWSCWR